MAFGFDALRASGAALVAPVAALAATLVEDVVVVVGQPTQGKVSLDATSPSSTTAITPPRRAKSALRRRWRAGAYFRGKLRRITAWAFNCFFYFMLCWIVITYAMQFGEKKTQRWLLSWVFASMHAWLIVEPAEVVLIACLPWLLENRCVSNCKEFAKELGIY